MGFLFLIVADSLIIIETEKSGPLPFPCGKEEDRFENESVRFRGAEQMRKPEEKKRRVSSPSRLIALVFLGIIAAGTMLLMLPASARSGKGCDFLSALFTAASATCVTGLTPFDTWTQWSGLGQGVLLCLIQIGGLGFMSVASLLFFLIRSRIGLMGQMVMAQSLGQEDMHEIIGLQKWMLKGCLLIEGGGAAILTARFCTEYAFPVALKLGVFHAVSAFCNAGFDLFGFLSPGASVSVYGTDPVILLTLSALVVLGGFGFIVWNEVAHYRQKRKLSVYSRLVLIATGVLLIGGTAAMAACEWNNPATLQPMSSGQKWLAAFFQSVTLRTAGFAGMDQGALTEAGKGVSMFLMLIGGSSGSTAGGLKTVTMLVIFLFLWSRLRGRSSVVVFHRTIGIQAVLNALTIFGVMTGLAFFGAVVISLTSPVNLTESLYESVSAIATVGLSCNATSRLSVAGKLLIIVYMYFGRVGVLTISMGFLKGDKPEPRFRYADTTLLIG